MTRDDTTPPPDLLALLRGFRVARLVLTCDADTAGGWKGDDPAPRLDIEFVSNANYFTRIRGANWFPVDSLATLGAAIDAIRDHNDREEKDHAP